MEGGIIKKIDQSFNLKYKIKVIAEYINGITKIDVVQESYMSKKTVDGLFIIVISSSNGDLDLNY